MEPQQSIPRSKNRQRVKLVAAQLTAAVAVCLRLTVATLLGKARRTHLRK